MGDVFYWGRRGSGKTAKAVFDCLLDWYSGHEIWTNGYLHPAFDINYRTGIRGNLHRIDAIDLINLLLEDKIPENDTPKTLLLDEIKTQANARNFGSFVNKNLTNFVSQARKRNFRIIYTDQIIKAYDNWIRSMTDKIVRCIPVIDVNDLGYGTPDYPEPIYFRYIEFDLNDEEIDSAEPVAYEISRKTMRNIYRLYKTKEIITPVELKHQEVQDV